MVVVDIHYLKPITDVEKHLVEHRAFLQKHYDAGVLLASGPKNPRDGGIILGLCSKEEMLHILSEDPFTREGISRVTITEFNPVKAHTLLQSLLKIK